MNAVEMSSVSARRPETAKLQSMQNGLAEQTNLQTNTATFSSAGGPKDQTRAEPAVTKAPTAQELGTAVESINQFVNAQMRTLNFSVDETSGKAVVKVIDFETKDVIRQIPGEEVLKMASAIKRLQEDLGSATGLLINNHV